MDDRVRAWVTANVGEIVDIERQHRWRPAWFVVAQTHTGERRLYVRGNRDGFGFMEVSREAAVLRVLARHGVPVPTVHGEIDGDAVVMDWLPGDAGLDATADPREVDAVMDSYVDALAAVHAIDPAEFAEIGIATPDTPAGVALDFFEDFVARYREFKQRPEPVLEFVIGWLRRRVPEGAGSPRFLLGDTGQFMWADGRVTGLIDVELAHVGDVAHDLAGLRLRAVTEHMGDLGRVLRRYEEVTGRAVDRDAVEFHTAKFAVCTPLGLVIALHLDLPMPEILQYTEWFHQLSLHAIECIARLEDVRLDPIALPDPVENGQSGVARGLATMVESLEVSDAMAEYRRETVAAVARYVERAHAHGPGIDAADAADVAELLGADVPADRRSTDQALEDFVVDAGPEHDRALVALLRRRVMRQMLLLEPVLVAPGGIGHVAPLPDLFAQ
ncbi:phosphotransferase family protein [uncultured Williamsia sp.]|uniref:phosphotransferase family protein n=1 Tax=uncultured Williamsia sp. TaxID=259311 RepID=UPI0026066DEB|nr:phosphotransferase family protein [uncultured Williamsia sp.]